MAPLSLLLAAALAPTQDDPAQILQGLEKALTNSQGASVSFVARSPLCEPYLGTLQFGAGNFLRLGRGTKQVPQDVSMICDGSKAVQVSDWHWDSYAVKPGFGDRVRSVFVRAGAMALLDPADVVDGRKVYLAQEEAGLLEISDLKAGPEAKDWKSLTYTLNVPALKRFLPTQIQLRYDPVNQRLLQRDSLVGSRSIREDYSDWKFKMELPEAHFKLPPHPRFAAVLRGRISLKGSFRDHGMSVGCVGVDHVSCPWGVGSDISLPSMDVRKLSWDPKSGMEYGFKAIPPGRHLVYLSWGERYFDWKWIQVGEDPRATVPEVHFTLDPASTGSVEIGVANLTLKEVMFVPADDEGKIPKWSPRLMGKALTGKVKEGKVLFQGLRPGKYVFYAPETEWTFDGFHKAGDGEGRTSYLYHEPTSMMDAPAAPPKIQVSAEVRGKSITRIELK